MSGQITIALDAMGGARAPATVVRGANIALRRFPQTQFMLFGDQSQLQRLLKRRRRLRKACTIHHTEEVVRDDAKPSVALRTGHRTSMRLAIDAVGDGAADGVVSAGNTGALMAMAKYVLKTLPGIDRPAIATFFPTSRGESVMLDLGANIDSDAENLVQFAVMGEVFARSVLGLIQPTVGLLNVGAEDVKGREAVKTASAVLRDSDLPIEFHGFIEGDDITAGTVDVIVTDGFTGNIAIKTAEGTARLYTEFLRQAFKSSPFARLGYLLARRALKKLRAQVDPRGYNGAMFLGLNGIAVKSHGSTDALGLANAIGVAIDMAKGGINEKIKEEFQRLALARENKWRAVS